MTKKYFRFFHHVSCSHARTNLPDPNANECKFCDSLFEKFNIDPDEISRMWEYFWQNKFPTQYKTWLKKKYPNLNI